MDFSDPIGMIRKGISDLIAIQKDSHEANLGLLARFEKAAAWTDPDWTYWDFLTAPEELAALKAQSLSPREVKRRCDDWVARDEAGKTALIREIETGEPDGMADRIRAMVAAGADPNEPSLLKDTPLAFARYHGREEIFDLLIELGANGEKAGFTKLHHAVRYGTLDDVTPLIGSFDSLWRHEDANSVLAEAVQAAKPEMIAALLDHLAAGNRLNEEEVATCFAIAGGSGSPDLMQPFIAHGLRSDIALDATLENFDVGMLKLLLAQGADVHEISDLDIYHEDALKVLDADGTPALRAYIAALLEAGWQVDDLAEFEHAQIRYVTEAYLLPKQDITAPGFLDRAAYCAGTTNPEERTLPYHIEMLRTGESSYAARQRMRGLPHAVWTADRFGQSTTRLPDGRWVQIGGEHEDFYDPDFIIFSDVVVHTTGAGVQVFFYPASIFPPTDFHTATLIGGAIWVIGGLGYMSDRQPGVTVVHRLDLSDFSMTRIDTTGDGPGWISRHKATEANGIITISGGEITTGNGLEDHTGTFSFDPQNAHWTRQG